MAAVELRGIEKSYAGRVALSTTDLEIQDGEIVVIVGPSGCGKSTLLRAVAGLEQPTAGRVLIDGVDVTDVPPQKRDIAMVFQSYALYPHKSVRENIGFGLKMAGVPKSQAEERVRRMAETLGLDVALDRKPKELSGGERQRVALGRALVREPKAFLLDEPLSNLDASLRLQMRAEIARLEQRFRTTTLYVTHDQEEALTLGSRIAVMHSGRIEQLGAPLEVYHRPATAFVARFIGSPPINLFRCRARRESRYLDLSNPHFSLRLGCDKEVHVPPEVDLGVRPHHLALSEERDATLGGRADVVERLGRETLLYAAADGLSFAVALPGDAAVRRGDPVFVRMPPEHVHVFSAETGERVDVSGAS